MKVYLVYDIEENLVAVVSSKIYQSANELNSVLPSTMEAEEWELIHDIDDLSDDDYYLVGDENE